MATIRAGYFYRSGGNLIDGNVPPFLSPEWGNVNGFALKEENKITYERNGNLFNVFHDPSEPPLINFKKMMKVVNHINGDFLWCLFGSPI